MDPLISRQIALAMTLLTLTACGSASAEDISVGQSSHEIRCKNLIGSAPVICTIDPSTALKSTTSLYIANNLTTKKSAEKLVEGATGSATLAKKIGPTLYRISKSLMTRRSIAISALGTGAIVVYESLTDTGSNSNAISSSALSRPDQYRTVGTIETNGELKPASSKQK